MPECHELMGGELKLYKRGSGSRWQCSTFLEGRNHRKSTKEKSLTLAKDIAEDWYLELRGKLRRGEVLGGRNFKQAAAQFEKEYEIITAGERSEMYVQSHKQRLQRALIPFFGKMALSEINGGKVQEYRIWRHEQSIEKRGRAPARNTLHQEIVTLRQVLKTALRHGWIQALPDISEPYKRSSKVSHRAWFSPQEYRKLYEASRRRADNPLRAHYEWHGKQLHDYILFMTNTGLRPDEAKRLQYRDVEIVRDDATGETILEIVVRGKRGVGYCKSTTGAVLPFRRLRKRNEPAPTDLIFATDHNEIFNAILEEEGLKFDREGRRRTAYSLRHTYICLRLMEGADIYQIAKNCRTSVEMIEKFYAAHIKNRLDAAAINVRRPKPGRRKGPRDVAEGLDLI